MIGARGALVGAAAGALLLAAVFPRALLALHPELAVHAAYEREDRCDPWGRPWSGDWGLWSNGPNGIDEYGTGDDVPLYQREDVPGPWAVRATAWAPEALAVLATLLAWAALAPGGWAPRSPRLAVEAGRVLLLASGPTAVGVGLARWLAERPWVADAQVGALLVPAPVALALTWAAATHLLATAHRLRRPQAAPVGTSENLCPNPAASA